LVVKKSTGKKFREKEFFTLPAKKKKREKTLTTPDERRCEEKNEEVPWRVWG